MKTADETIKAGRRFVARLSVEGKGTTTSSCSKITPRFLIFGGGPFAKNLGETLQIVVLSRRHLVYHQMIALNSERDHITRPQAGRLADAFGIVVCPRAVILASFICLLH